MRRPIGERRRAILCSAPAGWTGDARGWPVALIRRAVSEGFRDGGRRRTTREGASHRDDPELRAVAAALDDRVFPGDPFAERAFAPR
jgi:hypothetical protein